MFMVKTRTGGAVTFGSAKEMEEWARLNREIEAQMLWGAIKDKVVVRKKKRIRRKMKKHENSSRV